MLSVEQRKVTRTRSRCRRISNREAISSVTRSGRLLSPICATMLTKIPQLIALQLAMSIGGAEFYPMCAQVVISGSGTGTPSSDETCTFPGGYSNTDPGIYVPNVSAGFSDTRSIVQRQLTHIRTRCTTVI